MFIEINERLVNIINIQAIKEDEAALKILYRLSNGDYLEETFSSKADFDNKVKDIENAGGGGIKDLIIILPELPEEGEPNKIYLIPKQDAQSSDLYDEYLWVNEGTEEEPDWKWEWITTKQVDLSSYYTKEETAENFLKKDNAVAFTPSGEYNPATKKYVDANFLRRDNDTIYAPSTNYNPATKKYVDDTVSTAASNYIAKNNTTSYTPSGDYNPATKKYVDDAVTSLASDLASEYDSTKTYSVGDYVLYEGSLYKCNTDIDIAEVWTPAHWDTATISDIMHNAQDIMQYEVLPNITPENLGKIVQYIGTTNSYYINGYFYKATSRVVDGETIYVWSGLLVQPVPDISVKEDVSNKVNTLDPNSTTKYPNTKAVYDHVNTVFNSDLWHYKGHVNSTSNLPSTGQHSVTPEDPNIVISSALKATGINNEHWRNKISNVATEQLPNYLGAAWVNGGNLYSVAITTNDTSVIKGITYVTDANEWWLAGIRLEPNGTDTTKILFSAYSVHYFVTDTGGTIQIKNNTPFEVSQSGWVFLCRINKNATSFANSGAIALYSNLSYLKFIPYNLDTAYYSGNSYTVSKHIKTITNDEDYTYAQDFKLYLFDSTTGYCSYAGDEASPYVHENDIYTVGTNNDIYRCNDIPEWELLSAVDLSDYLPKDNTSSYTPTNDYNPATKKYVDDSIPTVPTSTSDLNNDSGFITNSVSDLTNYLNLANTTTFVPTGDYNPATKKYVDDAIAATGTMKKEIVPQLPTTGIDDNTIYMVPSSSASTNNYYDEYMHINNQWEKIGSTEVDLSNYLAKNNTTTFTPTGDYNPSTKKYVDDLFKSDLLHYKGHVDNTSELPQASQASGDEIEPVISPATNLFISNKSPVYNDPLGRIKWCIGASTLTSYSNYIGAITNYNGDWYAGAIMTNYPEQIKGINLASYYVAGQNIQGFYEVVHIKYDANKPVYYKTYGTSGNVLNENGTSYATVTKGTLYAINKDCWVVIGWADTLRTYPAIILSNLSSIKWLEFNEISYASFRSIGNQASAFGHPVTLKQTVNNFCYNNNMFFLKFDATTNEADFYADTINPTVHRNDVYTVSTNNDIYRLNEQLLWELWSRGEVSQSDLETTVSNIAPAYDNTQTYSVGDYTIYNNQLYVCNTDIQTAEDFDPTHWDTTTVAEILGNIKSLLGGI